MRGFNKYSDVASVINNELLYAITHHALILVSKFLEVWEDLGSLAQDDPWIVPARRAIKPLLNRIDVWKSADVSCGRSSVGVLGHPVSVVCRVHIGDAERTRKLPIGLGAIAPARTMGARCCRSG